MLPEGRARPHGHCIRCIGMLCDAAIFSYTTMDNGSGSAYFRSRFVTDRKETPADRLRSLAYFTSLAFNLISGPASAFDTGQFFFAASACSMKAASVRLATSASVFSSIKLIAGPSPR